MANVCADVFVKWRVVLEESFVSLSTLSLVSRSSGFILKGTLITALAKYFLVRVYGFVIDGLSDERFLTVPWLKKIIWAIGVLGRTVVRNWRFDNLCRSHLQSQLVVIPFFNQDMLLLGSNRFLVFLTFIHIALFSRPMCFHLCIVFCSGGFPLFDSSGDIFVCALVMCILAPSFLRRKLFQHHWF